MRIVFYSFIFSLCLFYSTLVQAKVTVALITPKAGDYAQQGAELERGVRSAVDEINKSGGIAGKKINLLVIDDQCNNSIAISTAQMLSVIKNQNVNLVIGPYCANSFDEVADIYAKAKIFQIIPTTVNYAHAKTIKKGLVKMLGYTNQQAKDFFNYYNSYLAGEHIALISNIDDAQSTEEASALINEFKKHGKYVVLKHYTYDMTGKDYKKLADLIVKDNNSVAFILGSSKNIRKTAYFLKKKSKSIKVFVNKYSATKEYFDYLGDLAEGTYFMELSGREDDPEFAETLVKLRLGGFETQGLSMYGYSAVKLWEALVKQTNSFDYNVLSKVVNASEIKTEFGNQMFHNGAPKVNETYAIYIYQEENFNKVY